MIDLCKKLEVRGIQSITFELDEDWIRIFQAEVDENYTEEEKTPITMEMVKEIWKDPSSVNYGLGNIVHLTDGTETTIGEILYDVVNEYVDNEGYWEQPEIYDHDTIELKVIEYAYD